MLHCLKRLIKLSPKRRTMRNLIKYLLSLIFAVETFGATNVVDVENKESAGGATGGFSFLEKGSYNGYYPFKRSGGAHLDLSENWLLTGSDSKISPQFAVSDSAEWISVEKPTSVQTAHFQAGKLPDPYVGLNSKLYEPLEKKFGIIKRGFPSKTSGNRNTRCFFSRVPIIFRAFG